MKILKEGTPPEEQVWAGECKTCGTIAEAKRDELKDIDFDPIGGYESAWVICPVCHRGGYGGMIFYPKGNK